MMNRSYTFFTLIALLLISAGVTADPTPIPRTAFVENRGQIYTTSGVPAEDVRFLYHNPGGINLQVRDRGLAFDLWHRDAKGFAFHRLDVNFIGSGSSSSSVKGLGAPVSRTNDYRHGVNCEDIPSYNQLMYKSLYNGIDLLLTLRPDGNLKYDLQLDESALITDVVLEYEGFDRFTVEGDELVFELSGRTIREQIPASWISATGQAIHVSYKILYRDRHKVRIGFDTDKGEVKGRAWVLDPLIELEWSTYYGGQGVDVGRAIATDSLGNVFVAGTTQSLDAIASDQGYQNEFVGGQTDAFLVKFNQHGLRHWSTYYGGSDNDSGLGVDVDGYDHVYLVGSTASEDLLQPDSALVRYQDSLRGGSDGFVAKFGRLGNLIWDTYLGSTLNDQIYSCTADSLKGVRLLGNTQGADLFDSAQVAVAGAYAGGVDIFIAALDPQGAMNAGGFLGGAGDDFASDILYCREQDFYVIGATTQSPGLATAGAFQTDLLGDQDGWTAFVDTSFNTLWASYIGGPGLDEIHDAALEPGGGAVYFCGQSDTATAYADTTSVQPLFGGQGDGFVVKILTNNDSLVWYTYVGGSEYDAAMSVDVDMDSSVYVLGQTFSDQGIVFFDEDSVESEYSGGGDVFLTVYDALGSRKWSTYYGGDSLELPNSLRVFGRTGIFYTGGTTSMQGLAQGYGTEGDSLIHQDEYGGGGADGFVARITGPNSTPPPFICCNCDDWGGGGYPGGTGGGGGGGGNGGGPGYQPIGICLGDSIRLSVGGGCLGLGAAYVWYQGECGGTDNFIGEGSAIYVSPTELTTYYVRTESLHEESACTGVTVHVDLPITVSATAQDSVCPGETVNLAAEGAETYVWTGPNDFYANGDEVLLDSATVADEGDYLVLGTSQFGCEDDTTVTVSLLPGPDYSLDVSDVLCIGYQNGSIAVSGGDTTLVSAYWTDNAMDTTYRDSLGPGTYQLTVTNIYGCESESVIEITEPEWPVDSLFLKADTCGQELGSALIDLSGSASDFDIAWSNGENANELMADHLIGGTYSFLLTDTNGCTYQEDFDIENLGEFQAVIVPDSIFLELLATEVIEVYALPEQQNPSYEWIPDSGLSCTYCAAPVFDPDTTAWYTALVTAPNGCHAADSVYVERELPLPGTFIPTAFSPNGDGLNDELCILGTRIVRAELTVFSRRGQKVFHTADLEKCWDGTFNGKPVIGTVMYTFEAVLEEDGTVSETGNINILR